MANVTMCTRLYFNSFTRIWAYRQNVLTCAFSSRKFLSIAINIFLFINTLPFIDYVIIQYLAGQQYIRDLCIHPWQYKGMWVINSCTQPGSSHSQVVKHQINNQTHSHFKLLWRQRRACHTTVTQTHIKKKTHITPYTCLTYAEKLHIKDFVMFPRKRHHKHPAIAFVHKNKATSV